MYPGYPRLGCGLLQVDKALGEGHAVHWAASFAIDATDVEESQPHKGELCFPYSSRVICLNCGLNTTYRNIIDYREYINIFVKVRGHRFPNVENLQKNLSIFGLWL